MAFPIASRELILSAIDTDIKPVDCPEWQLTVLVKSMSARDRDWLLSRSQADSNGKLPLEDVHARVAILVCVDSEGNKLFTRNDLAVLGEKSVIPLERIFNVAMAVSGIDKAEIAEIEGNSGAEPTGDSGFD